MPILLEVAEKKSDGRALRDWSARTSPRNLLSPSASNRLSITLLRLFATFSCYSVGVSHERQAAGRQMSTNAGDIIYPILFAEQVSGRTPCNRKKMGPGVWWGSRGSVGGREVASGTQKTR